MNAWLVVLPAFIGLYAGVVLLLAIFGRRGDARALAGFIPDCVVLVKRLIGDPRVPRRRKALLVGLLAYVSLPFDLVPDFIPLAGQLDDAILLALVLRSVMRGGGADVLSEHWPGPEQSQAVIRRLAFGGSAPRGDRRCEPVAGRTQG